MECFEITRNIVTLHIPSTLVKFEIVIGNGDYMCRNSAHVGMLSSTGGHTHWVSLSLDHISCNEGCCVSVQESPTMPFSAVITVTRTYNNYYGEYKMHVHI